MVCPECGTQYREGFKECSDCFVPLINSETPKSTSQPFIVVCSSCGQKNRISIHSHRFRAVCGRCHNNQVALDSDEIIKSVVEEIYNSPKPEKTTRQKVITAIGILIIAGFLVLLMGRLSVNQKYDDNQKEARSLPNNTMLSSTPLNGKGKLSVENGTDRDALVKIVNVNLNQSVATFYILSEQTGVLNNIPSGSYHIFYAIEIGIQRRRVLQETRTLASFKIS